MYRITTENGRVGHILDSIVTGPEGRIVTTVCGKTQPETDFQSAEGLDDCGSCDKKFNNLVNETPDVFATPKEAEKGGKELAKETEEALKAETVEETPRSSKK